MKRKLRIFSNIAIICLSVCMFAFGVYAANTVSVTTEGTVTFQASGVYAKIERTITGAKINPAKSEIIIDSSSEEGSATPMNADLEFTDAFTPIQIEFKITNLATEIERDIFVHVTEGATITNTADDNVIKSVEGLNNWFSITANTDATVTIMLLVDDTNKSAIAKYDYVISLQEEVTDEGYITLEHDSVNNNVYYNDKTFSLPDGASINAFGLQWSYLSGTKLIIPSYVNGKLVDYLNSSISNDISSITDLVLPNTIKYLDDYFLYNASSLNLSVLPSKLEYMNTYSFNSCSNVEIIKLPSGLKHIGEDALLGCKIKYLASFPSQITTISGNFDSATNMRHINLHDNITEINERSFYYCFELYLTKLPANLEKIGNEAFSSNEKLAITEIPSNVTTIGDSAFTDCYGLTSISIPASLSSLGTGSFNNCKNLKSVAYDGTMAQWNVLNADNKAKFGYLTDTLVTCSDGTITIPAWS